MPLTPIPISYNEHPEKTVSVESLVNMQPEFTYGGRQPAILRSCPGFKDFSTVGDTECRGLTFSGNILYAVLGKFLYSITSLGIVTQIGRVDGSGQCGIANSGEQVFIATGGINYAYTIASNNLQIVTDAPLGKTVAFINGRFVIEDPEATGTTAGRFYWSGLLDATTWNALNYSTAEQKPDRTIRVEEHNARLIVYGADTVEFWQGDAEGFLPILGTTQSVGIAGPHAAATVDNTACFLASDGSVRILNGYQAVTVSTPAVEAALAADSATECVAYREEGHTIFEFSTAAQTLCYDYQQSQLLGRPIWFRKSNIVDCVETRHKLNNVIYAFGKNIAGIDDGGNLFEFTRDANPEFREFQTPYIQNDAGRDWIRLHAVELIARSGTGAIPDSQPQMMMQVSRDNGYTWGEEKWVDMGTIGDYNKRIKWRQLGRALQASLRFRLTDDVQLTIIGLNARGS